MRDPFVVLGLDRSAREADVKTAYRTLAKKYHPDLYPGDQEAVEKFREICDAHDRALVILKQSRQPQYFKSWTAAGRRRPARKTNGWGFGGHEAAPSSAPEERSARDKPASPDGKARTGSQGDNPQKDETFSDFLRGFQTKARKARSEKRHTAVDTDHRLAVSFEDAALGAVRSVSLPDGRKVELRVPAGVKSGQKLRIRTKSEIDGQDQEILFQVDVEKHSYFELHGVNVHLELPVSVDEAVLGAKIPVPTVEGPVLLRIPPGSNAGTIFRMRGKGAAVPESAKNGKTMRGDQFVSLKVVLPENNDKNFLRLIRKWASKNSYSVRDHFNIPSFAE